MTTSQVSDRRIHFSRLILGDLAMLLPLRHIVIFKGFCGAELPQRQADDENR